MPKVITAEFFRRGLADKLRCVTIAPGYVATLMVRGMKPEALDKILQQVPIKRLVDTEEVASLIFELYRNEALAGEVFYVHGGLRLLLGLSTLTFILAVLIIFKLNGF